jgi:hypothetical protein
MIRRPAASTLAALLLCALCATSASANTPGGTGAKPESLSNQPAPRAEGKGAKPGEKLKADVARMLADAREGRSRSAVPPRQQPPPQSNSLSTGQKFAIAAVVVGALAIIYFSVFAGKHL